jgi:DNA end-binding protein Ku
MPRPLWKGALSFGLVTVPVNLYSAVENASGLSFHLLHEKDESRIEYKRICEKEGVEVPWSEIVKGYEYQKGKHVVLTDEDFEKAIVPATQTFDIRAFVPASDVDPLYFEQPYYVAPGGKGATKAYALLRDALEETQRVGIGTIVLRQREHLAALEPAGKVLVLNTMRFADEIRPVGALDLPARGAGWTRKEMQLAHQLIETLASDFDPRAFKDTYTDVLKRAIRQKLQGKEISVPQPERRPKVVDLMAALQASLQSKGRARQASAPRARRARRRRAAAA